MEKRCRAKRGFCGIIREVHDEIFLPVDNSNDCYHSKTPLFDLEINGKYRAYPFPELEKSTTPFFEDVIRLYIELQGQEDTGQTKLELK